MPVIFWCEFPEQVDFRKLNSMVKFKTRIYFAVHSANELKNIQKKVKSRNIAVGAWPVLGRKSGYWFSGFAARKDIDKLDDFDGLDIKIDIEPPIYAGMHSLLKDFFWFLRYSVASGMNNGYLGMKIRKLHGSLILSGFLLPSFIRKRYGDCSIEYYSGLKCAKNYICYTTFFPKVLRWIVRLVCSFIIKRMSKKNFFAIGLTNPGIFGNEPEYENIEEFKKDILMAKKAGVKNLCVYSIEGILKRKDAKGWFLALKDFC